MNDLRNLCLPHRDKERIRHQKLRKILDDVADYVPKFSNRIETKTRKLRRILLYTKFLEKKRLEYGKGTGIWSGKKSNDSVEKTKKKLKERSRKAHIVFLRAIKAPKNTGKLDKNLDVLKEVTDTSDFEEFNFNSKAVFQEPPTSNVKVELSPNADETRWKSRDLAFSEEINLWNNKRNFIIPEPHIEDQTTADYNEKNENSLTFNHFAYRTMSTKMSLDNDFNLKNKSNYAPLKGSSDYKHIFICDENECNGEINENVMRDTNNVISGYVTNCMTETPIISHEIPAAQHNISLNCGPNEGIAFMPEKKSMAGTENSSPDCSEDNGLFKNEKSNVVYKIENSMKLNNYIDFDDLCFNDFSHKALNIKAKGNFSNQCQYPYFTSIKDETSLSVCNNSNHKENMYEIKYYSDKDSNISSSELYNNVCFDQSLSDNQPKRECDERNILNMSEGSCDFGQSFQTDKEYFGDINSSNQPLYDIHNGSENYSCISSANEDLKADLPLTEISLHFNNLDNISNWYDNNELS